MKPAQIGQVVLFDDTRGTLQAAIITAVEDAAANQVRLSVFHEGGAVSDAEHVTLRSGPRGSW